MYWGYIIHFGIISTALLAGSLLRARVGFLQKYLIPASIIAGFFLLGFYNYVGPNFGLSSANMACNVRSGCWSPRR